MQKGAPYAVQTLGWEIYIIDTDLAQIMTTR